MTSSTTVSSGAARMALLSLAVGAFGIGMTEFVSMGLLPGIAQDLLPGRFASNPEDAIASAGILISLYALGVVIGAPTIAGLVARFPRHRVVAALLISLTIANVLTVIAPSFGLVALSRLLAGLPHGAYFGMAALVASNLMGPERRGKGVALVMSGLTLANVIGVPAGTLLGQALGWRAAYVVVALVFAAAVVMCFFFIPAQPGSPGQTLRGELAIFRLPQVWLTVAIGAIGFSAFFAVYSYVSTFVTEVAGADESLVPIALMATGIGMFVGNLLGGALADRSVNRTLVIGFIVLAAASALVAVVAVNVVTLMIALLIFGVTSQVVAPAIQLRLFDVSGPHQAIASSLHHSALNIGNSLGAALGGAVIAARWGYDAPAWVAVVVALIGLVIATVALSRERRTRVPRA